MTTENRFPDALTVTQLNEYIKRMIDGDPALNRLCVKGEISNFKNHYGTGHYYFTLKDDGGLIRAVMFRSAAVKLPFVPENGMKVFVHGRVSAFVRDGQYQLYADGMEPDGVGALYIAFEQLKRRLEAEGLFSEARKKPLPKIPTRVGIITCLVFCFLHGWNDLVYSMTFNVKPEMRPLTANIYKFMDKYGTKWNMIMAYGMILVIPVLLIFVFLQKYIVGGLTSGAIKE